MWKDAACQEAEAEAASREMSELQAALAGVSGSSRLLPVAFLAPRVQRLADSIAKWQTLSISLRCEIHPTWLRPYSSGFISCTVQIH